MQTTLYSIFKIYRETTVWTLFTTHTHTHFLTLQASGGLRVNREEPVWYTQPVCRMCACVYVCVCVCISVFGHTAHVTGSKTSLPNSITHTHTYTPLPPPKYPELPLRIKRAIYVEYKCIHSDHKWKHTQTHTHTHTRTHNQCILPLSPLWSCRPLSPWSRPGYWWVYIEPLPPSAMREKHTRTHVSITWYNLMWDVVHAGLCSVLTEFFTQVVYCLK